MILQQEIVEHVKEEKLESWREIHKKLYLDQTFIRSIPQRVPPAIHWRIRGNMRLSNKRINIQKKNWSSLVELGKNQYVET